MTKKVKHAQKPAAAEPETVGEIVPAAGKELEAAGLVVDGGGGAAAADGLQQPAEPLPAGTQTDGVTNDLGDGSGLGTALDDSDIPYGTATADPVADSIDADTVDDGADDDLASEPGGGAAASTVDGGDDGAGSAGDAGDGDGGNAVDVVETPFERLYRSDGNFQAALDGVENAMSRALRIFDPDPDKQLFEIAGGQDKLRGRDFAEAALLLREIGHARANVDVVAKQLELKGHRDEAGLSGPERVCLEVFLFTLASLDGFATAEAARLAREKEAAERKPPPPVPIDETTMEPTDDPMATWG